MNNYNYTKTLHRIMGVIVSLLFIVSCSNKDTSVDTTINLELSTPVVSSTAINQIIRIETAGDWVMSFQYPDGAAQWCSANPLSGSGNANIILSFSENTDTVSRSVIIIVRNATSNSSIEFAQNAAQQDTTTTASTGWMELPNKGTHGDAQEIIHYTSINGKTVRNYTELYDKKMKISYWVAYPHHPSYLGSSGRTDNWAYDPEIPEADQPDYTSGLSGTGYDRGHQIPSGDRTSSKASNSQTFYFTNMTPQLSNLNQRMWANLEGQVRSWMSACDTLYVVTGALLKTVGGTESITYVTDRSGNQVAVPNYYYKVLLRLKNGNYDAIGFWFNHKDYGNGNATAAQSKSVDEIEALTGFDFFPNLPDDVENTVEATWDPKAWGL